MSRSAELTAEASDHPTTFPPITMNKLIIAGGTGFLGQALARHFAQKSWQVVILTRDTHARPLVGRLVAWEGETLGPWTAELENATALVNLCGKSVNCRYNRQNRNKILESRTRPTRVLAEALQTAKNPPNVWLNAASATTYHHSLNKPMDDYTGEHGHGFSVEVCKAWEAAFFATDLPSIRRVALRTSMVLGHGKNSVYPILARLARFGLGGKISHGQQMVSWIHETDFVRAIEFVINNEELAGAINVTAPAPVRNTVFMKILRESVGRTFGIPHLKPILEIAAWLMRTETELTLKSRYAIPAKLLEQRFLFRYPFVDEALADLAQKRLPAAALLDPNLLNYKET